MGGAVSRFEENDWEQASGQLQSILRANGGTGTTIPSSSSSSSSFTFSSFCAPKEKDICDVTIDGASPTSAYGVYYLTKRLLMNQREFDITDANNNLLYTTRAVPKTMACFDVLGRELDEYLLRVTVDFSRRYWIVYRYGIPSFPGQKPDFDATTKIAMEYAERQEPTPILFRKCCIIVSKSRFIAVASMFGPSNAHEVLPSTSEPDFDKVEQEGEVAEDTVESEATQSNDDHDMTDVKKTEIVLPLDEPSIQLESSLSLPELLVDEDEDDQEGRVLLTSHSEPTLRQVARSMSSSEVISSKSSQTRPREQKRGMRRVHSAAAVDGHGPQQRPSTRQHSWFRSQPSSPSTKTTKTKTTKTDPKASRAPSLEGVIQLDGPLLLCQEIYNRIAGNHQTSIIDKSTVLDLLRQDKQYLIDNSNTNAESHDADGTSSATTGSVCSDNNPPPMQPTPEELTKEVLGCGREDFEETNKDSPPSSADDPIPGNTQTLPPQQPTTSSTTNSSRSSSSHQQQQQQQQQPLVGYWAWENTFRTQKVKMHVAKDADLALHIVLAIIVNQVRFERNAYTALAIVSPC